MNILNRIIAVALCFAMVVWTAITGVTRTPTVQEEITPSVHDSLIVWYTDEALTDYLSAAAIQYNETYGLRVLPKLHSADEFLESINEATISGAETPDVYIVTNDMLEKAYLSGLATEIDDKSNVVSDEYFSKAALNAVTYRDKKVAYPFYFEASALLYNKSYLYERAKNLVTVEDTPENNTYQNKDEEENEEEETPQEDYSNLTQEERIDIKVQESIPETFDELMEFADNYDAPAEVETVFKWDVRDIFYNYFFIGNYIDVGGEQGDDSTILDIYNLDSINAMKVYQELNQFFSFEYEDVTYQSVIDEFLEGKIVFTTATTDVISRLDTAIENGEFAFEYGLSSLPNLNDDLTSKGLSVTDAVAINGYSERKDDANAFAKYITIDQADNFYNKTGKLSANKKIEYENPNISVFLDEYAKSEPMPKMMATMNFWIQLEIAFSKIWAGGSVSDNLKALSEQLQEQVTGMVVTEEYIEAPAEEQTEEIEYLDEEAEREAANQEDTIEEEQ